MKLLPLLAVAILLIFAGCIKTNGTETAGAGQVEKTQEQKQEGVDLGISNSDLQIDDPGLDPTTDSSEDLERP